MRVQHLFTWISVISAFGAILFTIVLFSFRELRAFFTETVSFLINRFKTYVLKLLYPGPLFFATSFLWMSFWPFASVSRVMPSSPIQFSPSCGCLFLVVINSSRCFFVPSFSMLAICYIQFLISFCLRLDNLLLLVLFCCVVECCFPDESYRWNCFQY